MTSTTKSFLDMEAGEQREFLAEQLADWTEAGFWPVERTRTFYRRAKILAWEAGMPRAERLDVLRCDADGILAARGATAR
jgi:hypothetical protein